jgi:hypothetical protein
MFFLFLPVETRIACRAKVAPFPRKSICARARNLQAKNELSQRGHRDWPLKPVIRELQTHSGFSLCNVPAFIAWELANISTGAQSGSEVVGGHTRVAILTPRRCDLKTEPLKPVKVRLLMPILLASLALLIAFVGWRFVVSRTSSAFVKANYTKREYRIAMCDGVRLFTQVYAPKDSSQPHPFLVTRTPFSVAPYGNEAYRRQLGPSVIRQSGIHLRLPRCSRSLPVRGAIRRHTPTS